MMGSCNFGMDGFFRAFLGGTRRQKSAHRSLEARLAPAALARELGDQG